MMATAQATVTRRRPGRPIAAGAVLVVLVIGAVLVFEAVVDITDAGFRLATAVEGSLAAVLAWAVWSLASRAWTAFVGVLTSSAAAVAVATVFDAPLLDRVLTAPWLWVALTAAVIGAVARALGRDDPQRDGDR